MKIISKKDIEKYYFDSFCKLYKLPEGLLVYRDKPDVVIIGPRKIGIEITNFYIKDGSNASSEQRRRIIYDYIIRDAYIIYCKENGKRIEISFTFNDNIDIFYKKGLVLSIAKLGCVLASHNTGSVDKVIFKHIPELNHVYVNSSEYADSKWSVQQIYSVKPFSKERLMNILREKEKKSKEYCVCDEYWLLIVIDFMDMAQDQEIGTDNVRVESNIYTNIILYKTILNKIVVLKRGYE